MKRGFCILLVCASLFCGCKTDPNAGKEQIDRETLINVLVDVHLVDGYMTAKGYRPKDHSRIIGNAYNYVFEKYGITHSEFMNTMKWYSNRTDQLELVYNKVIVRLQAYEAENEPKRID
ncbi:MAG: DUF4296 domain-containing protein [Salinivirgaceae bacterium]|nr:DUF4296 domain-containing protein [Salinivirgaceae bacterium]